MTSDGSPYTRFRQALTTGNLLLVRTAAAELPYISLPDALEICLLLRDGDPDLYERASVRWAGRFALEGRDVTLQAIQRATAALDALPERPNDAMESLAQLCVEHRLAHPGDADRLTNRQPARSTSAAPHQPSWLNEATA